MSGHAITQDILPGNLTALDFVGFPVAPPGFIVRRSAKRLPPLADLFTQFLPGKEHAARRRPRAPAGARADDKVPGKIVAEQR
jgi:hypothetical protein